MLVPGGQYKDVKMQDAATATGNGTAVTVGSDPDTGAYLIIDIQVTGISGDTITFEGTIDDTNWVAIQFENLSTGATSTTTSVDGIYRLTCGGLFKVRARISTYSAGTITVVGSAAA